MLKENNIKKRRLARAIGFAFLLVGLVIILASVPGITGFAVFDGAPSGAGFVLGIVAFLVGIVMLSSSRKIEEKESALETAVSVYDALEHEKNKDRSYTMTDPKLHVSRTGQTTLGDFKKEISRYRRDDGGEELVQIVRKDYEPSLKKFADSDDEERSRIAVSFLKVLDPNYKCGKEIEEGEKRKNPGLSLKEKREIRDEFRSYDGTITSGQRAILRRYDLAYEPAPKGGHPSITDNQTHQKISLSSTPSDSFAGMNIANDVIHMVERRKNEN